RHVEHAHEVAAGRARDRAMHGGVEALGPNEFWVELRLELRVGELVGRFDFGLGDAVARALADVERARLERLDHERGERGAGIDVIEGELLAGDVDPAAIVDDAVGEIVTAIERDRQAGCSRRQRGWWRVQLAGGERDDKCLHSSTATVSPTSCAASRGSARPASTAATPAS